MTEDVSDHHGVEILDPDTCFALLAERSLGRVGFVEAGTPRILPVNHLDDDATEIARLDGAGRETWAMGPDRAATWVRIRPDEVSGRRVGPAQA